MTPRLTIHYGTDLTTSVLTWPGGAWTTLAFDGGATLSSAVHVSGSGIVAGAEAWRRAADDPDGFVCSPLRAGFDPVTVNGTSVDTAALAAATLRRVAAEAARIAGAPIDDVRIVVPAGWRGPRRRTCLRRAAGEASLPMPQLVEAPIAAARQLEHADGRPLLIIDVGAECEVTVVQADQAGLEVLATLADPAAGGDGIDAALNASLTGVELNELPAGQRWAMLAGLRTARHALSEQAAVIVPMPGQAPAMVVTAAQLSDAAQPVFVRAAELAAAAVANADLSVDELGAVHLIGGAAATPGAADLIASKLGVVIHPAEQPGLVSLLGAAGADPAATRGDNGDTAASVRLPPLRRLAVLGVPGVLSLVLFAHFAFTADFNNGTPGRPGPGYYVLAAWGELTMASVLAMITLLQAGPLLAALIGNSSAPRPVRPGAGDQIAAGLGIAAGGGIATASLYAITAALYIAYPISGVLRWSVLPILPLTVCALALAALAWRRHTTSAGGWDAVLAFPVSSTLTATAGIFAMSLWWHTGLPWWANGWADTVGYLGGILIDVGIVCALARQFAVRIGLAMFLVLFTLIISRSGPDIPAVLFALAAAAGWARRAGALARTTPEPPPT